MVPAREDAILPMTDDYMQQIVRGEKNYEFRRYRISGSVRRVWFYLTAPLSSIVYICQIDPARTRNPRDEKLVEDGLGNKEFNDRHRDWDGYDYAYRILSVHKLKKPIGLKELKARYGMKGAPRGLIYLPAMIMEDVPWRAQEHILPKDGASSILSDPGQLDSDTNDSGVVKRRRKRNLDDGQNEDLPSAKKQTPNQS